MIKRLWCLLMHRRYYVDERQTHLIPHYKCRRCGEYYIMDSRNERIWGVKE
jgi:hypothetical protein